MSASLRRLGRDTLLYGLSSVLGRAVSVLLLPVYTRFLSPAQYGLLQLLDIAVEITFILFTAGTRSGMMRFYYRATSDRERRTVAFTTFALEMSLALGGAAVLALAAHPVWRLVLVGEGTTGLVRLAALNFLLGTLAYTPFSLLQTEQRAVAYTVAQMAKLALQVGFNLFFLVHLEMGVLGMMLSSTVVNALMGVVLAGWLIGRTGLRLSRPVLRDLRRFGVPYQVTTAGAFILTFGDRFFLQRFKGAADVGLYGLAYQFGFLLYQLSTQPFLRAWEPQRFQQVREPAEVRNTASARGFFYFNLLLLSMATGIAVTVRPVLAILTTQAYHSAADLVPVILAAYVVHSWVEAVKFGIDVSEKTRYYTYASWAAVVVVLAGYGALIPGLGGLGAALATLLAFLVRFALTLHWSGRLWPTDYGWLRIARLAAVAAAVSTAGSLVRPVTLPMQVAAAVLWLTAYAGLVWFGVMGADDRRAIRNVASGGGLGVLWRGS